ncbi:predicted protein [Naegleria gruberi]|uniref:Predicted protein n=1 Tax=Naegleria gruberi TaxID=5762 RepID=D2VWU4_NAEGR|nr:uncharacterized protein NAEGRDRAFT_52884 [Naegleria gruberi]EFC38685.1 predicted protein [Naegleria gruberi]|eukprot:XP_002671429.1 predicted protein [Naegleria gruberi strain NEG-M]
MIGSSSVLLRRLARRKRVGGAKYYTNTTDEEEMIDHGNDISTVGTHHPMVRYLESDEEGEAMPLISTTTTNGGEKALSPIGVGSTIDDALEYLFHKTPNNIPKKKSGATLSRKESDVISQVSGTRFMYFSLANEERRLFSSAFDVIQFLKSESGHFDSVENDEAKPFWLDCQLSPNEDVDKLRSYFKFEPTTAENCYCDHFEVSEKWEYFDNYFFCATSVRVKEVKQQSNNEKSAPSIKKYFWQQEPEIIRKPKPNLFPHIYLSILLFENCIITFHEKPFIGFDIALAHLERKYARMTGRVKYVRSQDNLSAISSASSLEYSLAASPSFVFHNLMDSIVEKLIPTVDGITKSCDMIDEFALSFSSSYQGNSVVEDIADLKRKIVVLRKLIVPKQRMFVYLVSHYLTASYFAEDVRIYMRDVLDHLTYSCDKLEMAVDALSESHTNYLTKLQIEMAQASSITDKFMNRLSSMAMIYAPLTLIGTVWGMNCQVPGQNEDSLYWFFGICGFMVLLVVVIVILLRKKIL